MLCNAGSARQRHVMLIYKRRRMHQIMSPRRCNRDAHGCSDQRGIGRRGQAAVDCDAVLSALATQRLYLNEAPASNSNVHKNMRALCQEQNRTVAGGYACSGMRSSALSS